MSRLCVVGSWHLASVMGACFAEVGHTVRGVDSDAEAIASLAKGEPTVFEPDLQESISKSLKARKLSYTTDFAKALKGISMVVVALDTPILENGDVDVRPIRAAVRRVARAASKDYVLVIASQVPVGTCEKLQEMARKEGSFHCDVVCNPEFLRLGGAMALQRHPDRVILGADDPKIAKKVETIYKPFDRPTLVMSLREAEIVKHATNAIVATQVSFIGEIGQICDEYGADAMPVAKALKLDRRVGPYAYVRPGLGFNGGTVSRDVKLLIKLAKKKRRTAPLLQAVLDVNKRTNNTILTRLVDLLGKPKGKKIALLGLTYKAETSTLRHSLTLQMAEEMERVGFSLRAYDPVIPPDGPGGVRSSVHEWDVPESIRLCGSVAEAADGAHALVIMTGKPEFENLSFRSLARRMKKKVLADAAGIYEPAAVKKAGFTYISIGRGFRWL